MGKRNWITLPIDWLTDKSSKYIITQSIKKCVHTRITLSHEGKQQQQRKRSLFMCAALTASNTSATISVYRSSHMCETLPNAYVTSFEFTFRKQHFICYMVFSCDYWLFFLVRCWDKRNVLFQRNHLMKITHQLKHCFRATLIQFLFSFFSFYKYLHRAPDWHRSE